MTDNVVTLFVNDEEKKQRFFVQNCETCFYISDSLYPDLIYTDKEKCVFSRSEQSLKNIVLVLNKEV
jgi:hypothetical protein